MTKQFGPVVQQVGQLLDSAGLGGLRDAQLLQRFAQARDEAAFATLVQRHGPLVLGVCQRILPGSDAEDAFQATFLVLARRAVAIRKADSLAAWLYGVALRLAQNMKRDASKRRQRELQAPPPAPQQPPDLAWGELQAALDEELQRLPQNHRQPLLLCYFEGLTQEEAAQQLGWPRGTLKRRLERGRELLKRRLVRRGLSLATAVVATWPATQALAVPLPTPLGSATVKAALPFAARQLPSPAAASARVITLAEGVLQAMSAAKLKYLLVLLAFGLGAVGALLFAQPAPRSVPADTQAAAPPLPPEQPQPAAGGTKTANLMQKQAETTKRFEKLAGTLETFQTHEFAYGRGDAPWRLIPKKWTDAWLPINQALVAGKDDVGDLVMLLKHNNANVRLLALAALFERQDPTLLPHLAAMVGDKDKVVPELQIARAVVGMAKFELEPGDFQEQTVGSVAQVFLRTWLEPAGYSAKDFDTYWAARMDRKFCASWFLARFCRAAQYTTGFDKKRAPLIHAIRKEIDALPAPDRDWILLWLATNRDGISSEEPRALLATPQELLAAGKRLGPDRLMDLIHEKDISTDPDLAPRVPPEQRRTRCRDDVILWVLQNAGQLLRPADAPALLAVEQKLRDRPAFCAIAAAELQSANARLWLRQAMERFAGKPVYTHLSWKRAQLAAALWRIVGASEIDYLTDWFYGEKVNSNPHSTQTGMFLEAIKGVRAPADRKLVARLVTDPRLDKLDYQSLQVLIAVASNYTKAPILQNDELRAPWERGSWGPETPKDFQVMAQWREKLRKSLKEWQLPD